VPSQHLKCEMKTRLCNTANNTKFKTYDIYQTEKHEAFMYCHLAIWHLTSDIQRDQKVSVHLMITIQKVASNIQRTPCQSPDIHHQGQGDTRLTLMPSVIPNSNYIIMVSDWNFLKYFCLFLYYNYQVFRDFLITLYLSCNVMLKTFDTAST
jgi:hypothetical protein